MMFLCMVVSIKKFMGQQMIYLVTYSNNPI